MNEKERDNAKIKAEKEARKLSENSEKECQEQKKIIEVKYLILI